MPCFSPLEARKRPDGSLQFYKRKHIQSVREYRFKHAVTVFLPCGRCTGCRLEYSKSWALRCVHEAFGNYNNNMFITLTYSPVNIPIVNGQMTLDKSSFIRFMKRLRHEKPGIRFFACGEYSPEKRRPHYHVCIFGHRFDDLKESRDFNTVGDYKLYRSSILESKWKEGFSRVGEINFQSCAYTARYIMKKVNGKIASEHYGDRQPEFSLMSRDQGLGYSWYKDFAYTKQIGFTDPQDFVTFKSYKGNIVRTKQPRYYDKLLERFCSVTYEKLKSSRLSKSKLPDDDRLIAGEFKQSQKLGKLIRQIA